MRPASKSHIGKEDRLLRRLVVVLACGTAAAFGLTGFALAQGAEATPASSASAPSPARAAAGDRAQAAVLPFERRVTLDVRGVTIDSALASIATQARVTFVYTDKVVPPQRRVTVRVTDVTVRRALEVVLGGMGIEAREIGEQVVLSRGRKGARAELQSVAPDSGYVFGVVRDSLTGKPLRGAVIDVEGTTIRFVTEGDSGAFSFNVPTGMRTIVVRMLGYKRSERKVVVVVGSVRADFALELGLTRLQEVVTTATGPRRRMDLPNDVTVLDVDSIVATQPVTSVTDLLATRVPGLTVQHTSGAPGDPARLRLRGASSISRSNDPIVIVDGVRVYYDQSGSRGENLAHGLINEYGAPSPLDQLDVHSIETIEVLKGPSAATLYGADAANGVIVITTKKGRPGPARWTVSAARGLSYIPGRYPESYLLWGHDYTGSPVICSLSVDCGAGRDSLVRFQALNAPDLTVLDRGASTNLTLGVTGGTSGLTYSLTGSDDEDTGPLKLPGLEANRFETLHGYAAPSWMRRPETLSRWSATGRVTAQVSPKLDASFTTTLTRENQQRSSLEQQLAELMSTYVDRTTQTYYRCEAVGCDVVPALVPDFYERATDQSTNFTNAGALNWRPTTWLTANADAGINVIARADEVLLPRDMLDTLGRLSTVRGSSMMNTVNVRFLATAPLPKGFRFQLATGANYTKTAIADLGNSVTGLVPGTSGINGATQVDAPSETVNDVTNLGWYVEPTLAHKRFLLDAGIRLDGGSTYGTHVKLPTFPKLGGTWLISDERWFPLKRMFSTLRLRAAYGHAGVQPAIADRLRLFAGSDGFVDGRGTPITTISTLGNTQLKPERSTELEGGFDADLFDDRFAVSLSGYRKVRKDALLDIPVAPSVYGYATVWKNIGVVLNTGFEATMTTQLVRTDPVSWSWTLGVSRNRNVVVSLAPGMAPIDMGGGQRVVAGYPLFGMWAKPIKGYADANGDGIIQPAEVQVGDSLVYLGSSMPNYDATFQTTVSLLRGALTVDAGLAYEDGLTQVNETVYHDRFVARAASDPTAPLGEQAAIAALDRTDYGLIQTVNTLRFNSLSVAYHASPALARRVGASAFSLALQGTNLGLHTNYRGKDPDVNAFTTGNGVLDTGVLPQPRTWRLALSASF